MNCYFDGSVGGNENEWLTLGGIVATAHTLKRVEAQWAIMLRERYPIAPYLHLTDLLTGNDPFERRAGWTDHQVTALINDVLSVVHAAPKHEFCAFACSIDTHARERLVTEGYKIDAPAIIAAEIGIGNLFTWYRNKHGMTLAHLFYDKNEAFIRSIRTRWLKYYDPGRVTTDLFWGSIATVTTLEMRDTPGLQIADLIAWAVTRRLRNTRADRWGHLADTLIGNRTHPGLLTATQLDPIDETIMRRKYAKA